jgi:hypothetical protein
MVRQWQKMLGDRDAADVLPGAAAASIARARHVRRAQVINAIGAVFTAVVLIVVFATKVTQVSGWNSATTRA